MTPRPAATASDEAVLARNLALLPADVRERLRSPAGLDLRSRDGGGVDVRCGHDRWVPVHPSADPRSATDDAVRQMVATGAPPVVIAIGLGLGYLLDALDAHAPATRVVAIEPLPDVTRAMLARRDWTPWLGDGRLTLLVGPDYPGAAEAWRAFGASTADPPTLVAPLLGREFPAHAADARRVAAHLVAGVRANAAARRHFAGRYLVNTLRNVPAIVQGADAGALTGAFAGAPAIVVAAGPSLDDRLELVAAVADRALVIAVDTAVRPLLAAGIRPDVAVAVDPSDVNGRHLQHLGDVRGLWLVAEGSLSPEAFPAFDDRTFTFRVADHDPWPWLRAGGVDRATLRAWGSVLTTAFDLACVMGAGPIVFVGADLAYSSGLQYCRNTTFEPAWRDCPDDAARAARFAEHLATLPHSTARSLHGRDVITAPHFIQFRDWLVARAAEWATAGAARRVLNASADGILCGTPIEIATPDVARAVVERAAAPGAAREWSARLAKAYHGSVASRPTALTGIGAALAAQASWPLDTWVAFGGATHSRDEIVGAAEQAAAAVGAETRAVQYLARMWTQWNRPRTIDEAARAIHPDYAFAVAQAPAQIAGVCRDAADRGVIHAGPGLHPNAQTTRVGGPGAPKALDVACGLGRMMRALAAEGYAVDGVDISASMIALARHAGGLDSSRFFVSSGADCGEAPDGAYELATMFHALHRVQPRAIRRRLLAAIARTLRPGGVVYLQVPFFPDRTPATVPAPHVPWASEAYDTLEGAEGGGEVWTTPAELPLVIEDLDGHCRDVRLQVIDFPDATPRFGFDAGERLAHLVISAASAPTLARRLYASDLHADPR